MANLYDILSVFWTKTKIDIIQILDESYQTKIGHRLIYRKVLSVENCMVLKACFSNKCCNDDFFCLDGLINKGFISRKIDRVGKVVILFEY
jgi:hypothetical protein